MLALIFYKPAAAAVYATAFTLIGTGKDIRTVLMGFAMVFLSLLALPVLMRLFTWTTGQVADSAGGRRIPADRARRGRRDRRAARLRPADRAVQAPPSRPAWCRPGSVPRTRSRPVPHAGRRGPASGPAARTQPAPGAAPPQPAAGAPARARPGHGRRRAGGRRGQRPPQATEAMQPPDAEVRPRR